MAEWIPCGDGFIEADVIRWKEGIWDRRGPRSARAMKIGDRLVIAEVLGEADEEGWVWLLVRGCEVISDKQSIRRTKPLGLEKDKEIKRQRKTLARGKPERLLWSDENARDVTASRFLGNRKPVPTVSKSKDTRGN